MWLPRAAALSPRLCRYHRLRVPPLLYTTFRISVSTCLYAEPAFRTRPRSVWLPPYRAFRAHALHTPRTRALLLLAPVHPHYGRLPRGARGRRRPHFGARTPRVVGGFYSPPHITAENAPAHAPAAAALHRCYTSLAPGAVCTAACYMRVPRTFLLLHRRAAGAFQGAPYFTHRLRTTSLLMHNKQLRHYRVLPTRRATLH